MSTTREIIIKATSLPVEERAIVVDSLLRSLNPLSKDIDRKWTIVAKRRIEELRSGKVKAISGDKVFAKTWKRFSK